MKHAVRAKKTRNDSVRACRYVQKIRSLGGMGVRKGGSVGKSKRR